MKLIQWLLAASLLATSAMAAPPPDPARVALAQKVVALVFPASSFNLHSIQLAVTMSKFGQMQVVSDEEQAQPDADPAKLPQPDLDPAALNASLTRAVDAMAPKYEAGVTQTYATSFTADQLSGMLAFFASPAGTTAIARRKAWSEADLSAQEPGGPDKPRAVYVETRAEKAFDASPPGQALKRQQAAISQDASRQITVLWPPAMAAAEADYCARKPCGEAQHKVFAFLGNVWRQDGPPAAH